MSDNEFEDSQATDVWGVVSNPEIGKAPFALRILKENAHIKTVRLEPDVTYIGRMPENHVVLDDVKVSRSHARVIKKAKDFVIEDQQSENGIFINGKKVKEYPLKPGLLVGIGNHVLEVVKAQSDDREANLERQLDEADAEEQEWRMDQTVSGTPEQIAKMIAAKTPKKNEKKKESKAPKMKFSVQLGGKTFQQEFEFTQIRAKKSGDPTTDQVEIRICVGNWVLYKKASL